jgi:hypothetical protein
MMNEGKINVTVHRKLNDPKTVGDLYSGRILFRYGDGSDQYIDDNFPGLLTEKGAISPGFFRNLDDLAESISLNVKGLLGEFVDPSDRSDLVLSYDSNTSENSPGGPRGYTDSTGSYLQRPFNDEEMQKLISVVDKRLRPYMNQTNKKTRRKK